MSLGLPFGFGALPLPDADPNDVRRLFQKGPLDSAQLPALDTNGIAGMLVHQPGAKAVAAGRAGPAVAMEEADTQRPEAQTGMTGGGALERSFDRTPLGPAQGFSGAGGAVAPPAADPRPPVLTRAPFGFTALSGAEPAAGSLSAGRPAARGPTQTGGGGEAPTSAPMPPPRPPEFGASVAAPDATAAPGQSGGAPEPSFGDRFKGAWSQFAANGGGDLLTSIGIGLLSTPGFGAGLAAGMKNYQTQQGTKAATDLARIKTATELRKLAQDDKNTNLTAQAIARDLGISYEQAVPYAANKEFATAYLKKQLPPSEQYETYTDDKGNLLSRNRQTGQVAMLAQAKDGSFTLGQGQVRYDEGGNPVARGPAGAPKVQQFTLPDGTKATRVLDESTGQWVDPNFGANPPVQAATNPFATGRFNNDQGKAAGFTDRMMGSEQILRGLEDINSGIIGGMAGSASGVTPNTLKSSDRQRFEQAQRDFVNAQLRRESGAAISQKEFDNAAKQYFPQPGDGSEVIAQKRVNRQRAIEAMGREGGPSYVPRSVFDQQGSIVPYQQRGAPPTAAAPRALPDRSAIEAEMRRRGMPF